VASLQAYQSHGIRYYRIVESFRKDGKPSIRVLAHLGRVDDILQRHQEHAEVPVKISSVSTGAVTALHRLTQAVTSDSPTDSESRTCTLPSGAMARLVGS